CLFVDNTAPVAGGGFWATRAHLEMEDCVFLRNEADFGGGAHVYGTSGSILRSSWSGNRARQSGGGLYAAEGHLEIGRATFVDNEGRRGGAIALLATAPTDLLLRESIVAFNKGNQAIDCGKGSVDAWRSDVWGNTGGDWTDCLTGQLGLRGNISADPLFCDRVGGDLRVEESSPCATGLGLEDGPMGAFPVGCGAPRAEDTAMGALLRERAAGAAARTEASGEGGNETVPDDGTLREPYLKIAPNPFREGIEIELALPGAIQEPIELAIFDSAGRRVRSLDPASTGSGVIRSTWDGRDAVGRDVPWGTYFCRARAGDRVVSERIVKIRSARSR
ncbi:MAG: T9SS type A sorting domain-containing protein, partial [Candidatus Eisenbacteria bacterium]|nr:T9SS type A sorting domain-containing protein [Candidatus Eisenbacteria bacterium]